MTAWLFAGGRGDLNILGAFQHMLADALVSLGVVVAGGLILLTGWTVFDPLLSLVIAGVILWGTWGLLRESLNISLDGVPEGVKLPRVSAWLSAEPSVSGVHDLHV